MSPAVEVVVIVMAGLLSGFINTLASSGSAVTLPLMILIGLLATVANGTNLCHPRACPGDPSSRDLRYGAHGTTGCRDEPGNDNNLIPEYQVD